MYTDASVNLLTLARPNAFPLHHTQKTCGLHDAENEASEDDD